METKYVTEDVSADGKKVPETFSEGRCIPEDVAVQRRAEHHWIN